MESKISQRRLGKDCRVEFPKPVTYTQEQRKKIEQIYAFRKEAGRLYKFNGSAGRMIQELRMNYLRFSRKTECLILSNTKWNITLEYPITHKKTALRAYHEALKTKKEALRSWEKDLTNTGYDAVSKIHYEPNGVISWFYQRLLSKAKYPATQDTHIGIEIECYLPLKADISAFKGLAFKLSLIGDGSIRAPQGYKPQEIRLLTTVKDYQKDITEVCNTLKQLRANVNESCGLHVHLDMRGIDREVIKQRFVNLVRAQKYLQGLVSEKRRMNTYCKPTRACDPFIMRDRYHAINGAALHKYNTIEIRLHHGTINPEEIVNWITLLESTMTAEPIKRCPSTLESYMKKINLEEKLQTYVKEKIRLNPPVQAVTVPETETIGAVPPGLCRAEHGEEDCEECGQTWDSGHDGHMCLDEDRNTTDTRGRFPGCVTVAQEVSRV